jgi:hypothetical protein
LNFKDWLTISDIAKKLNRSRAWVHKLREAGKFPSVVLVADRYLIHRQDLDNYIHPNANLEAQIPCGHCEQALPLKYLYPNTIGQMVCIPCYRKQSYKESQIS